MSPARLLPLVSALLCTASLWVGMRMLVPSLEQGRLAENYRGRQVFHGLGVVWLVWAGFAVAAGVLGARVDSSTAVLVLAGLLALVAFALGVVDDFYGTGRDRGFRGHLRALASGRLTTGGLKLFGISVASYVAALALSGGAAWGASDVVARLLIALPAGAAIALTANFVNLTDLRPGRALKVYVVLAMLGSLSVVLGSAYAGSDASWQGRLLDYLAIVVFVAAPVVAVWRYDLKERGMLGDAGANAMGAVAGLLVVSGLPLWALGGYLAIVLGLNVASEKFSFSRVIEGSSWLKRFDDAGRDV